MAEKTKPGETARDRIRRLIGSPLGTPLGTVLLSVGFVVVAYALLAPLDPLEHWHDFAGAHEDWEIDELPLVPLLALIALAVIYRRLARVQAAAVRTRDREIDRRITTEQELVRSRERLEAAIQHRELFFNAMSHDLRTPLNSVLAYGELLSGDSSLSVKHRDYARRISASGDLLLMLVDEIMDVASLEAGRDVQLRPESLALSEEIRGIIDFCCFIQNRSAVDLQIASDLETVGLVSDRRRFRQCVSNLVFNAFKHGGRSVRVWCTVELAPANGALLISVLDNGPGVPDEKLGEVSGPISRRDGTFNSTRSSHGFGLYLVSQYMRMQDGRLILARSPLGGCQATLEFPTQAIDRTSLETRRDEGPAPLTA